ncbi:MAG: glycerophosphoryl diester phosphodiesterase [Psychromonas sp.]
MQITAHRGVSSLAPENTLAAFSKAIELDCEWIEIDVQLTLDKVPVVIHDSTVNRSTNGEGLVSEMTLQNLKSLDAGLWFGDAYKGESIPTFEETLLLAKKSNLKVNIELKVYLDDDILLLCKKVNQVIRGSKIADSQLLFSSFNREALKMMQYICPQVRRGQLWREIPTDALLLLEEIKAYSVHCNYRFLNEQQATQIKQNNYQLYCYTPNQPDQVKQHWSWGVDMMITDTPQAYADRLQ